jgi:hypothetical protein
MRQHQVDCLRRALQEPGSEWRRHQRARQEQFNQLQQHGVGAGPGHDPACQFMGEDQQIEIFVAGGDSLHNEGDGPSPSLTYRSIPSRLNYADGALWKL